jgi:class 3 adenylate cyclase
VNLAARLVRAADPSSALVSDPLPRLAGSAFAFEPITLADLKGFGQPVTAHRLGRSDR